MSKQLLDLWIPGLWMWVQEGRLKLLGAGEIKERGQNGHWDKFRAVFLLGVVKDRLSGTLQSQAPRVVSAAYLAPG